MIPLHAALDGCAAHDSEHLGGLSDHLPMVLVALHGLGAGAQRLPHFAKRTRRG